MKFEIDSLLRLDDSGLPKPIDVRQMTNKAIRELYTRDKTAEKSRYIDECIIIYMCGDPKSPARQQGLSDTECLKYAIGQTTLPKNYKPDVLVQSLIRQYNDENLTEAGRVVDNLLKAIHNENKIIDKYLLFLNAELESAPTIDSARQVADLMADINKIAKDIPGLTAALNTAKQNIMLNVQEEQGRGGSKILSSMNAENYID